MPIILSMKCDLLNMQQKISRQGKNAMWNVALEDEESLRLYGNGKRQIPKRRRRKRS